MFVAIVLLTVLTIIAVRAVTLWIDAPVSASESGQRVFDA
jgi:hypothetical protein